jgi:hypothetical protein
MQWTPGSLIKCGSQFTYQIYMQRANGPAGPRIPGPTFKVLCGTDPALGPPDLRANVLASGQSGYKVQITNTGGTISGPAQIVVDATSGGRMVTGVATAGTPWSTAPVIPPALAANAPLKLTYSLPAGATLLNNASVELVVTMERKTGTPPCVTARLVKNGATVTESDPGNNTWCVGQTQGPSK